MNIILKNMRWLALSLITTGSFANAGPVDDSSIDVQPAPNGIEIPAHYKDWKLISSSMRNDKHSLRVVLGNPIAIEAVRKHQTNPWPNGAILAKLVWHVSQLSSWPQATVPGEFEQAEFMIKNAQKYSRTGGWGYARWMGMEQKPYGHDKNFSSECLACHAEVSEHDYVFTVPAQLP